MGKLKLSLSLYRHENFAEIFFAIVRRYIGEPEDKKFFLEAEKPYNNRDLISLSRAQNGVVSSLSEIYSEDSFFAKMAKEKFSMHFLSVMSRFSASTIALEDDRTMSASEKFKSFCEAFISAVEIAHKKEDKDLKEVKVMLDGIGVFLDISLKMMSSKKDPALVGDMLKMVVEVEGIIKELMPNCEIDLSGHRSLIGAEGLEFPSATAVVSAKSLAAGDSSRC